MPPIYIAYLNRVDIEELKTGGGAVHSIKTGLRRPL